MNWKMKKMVICISLVLWAGVAQASSVYKANLIDAQYPNNTASCLVCHTGYPGTMTRYGLLFKAAGGAGGGVSTTVTIGQIDGLDADADGFTNGQEFNGKSDVNLAANTPFTAATGGLALANVYVSGDPQAVEFAITDIYTQASITLPTGKEVLGGTTATTGVAVDIYATPSAVTPVTLLFKAGGVDAAASVYVIDTYAQTNTPLAATDWAITPNGGVQIKLLPNGISTPARIAVVRTTPTVSSVINSPIGGTTLGGGEGNENENEGNGAGQGCITGHDMMPFALFMLLLWLGIRYASKGEAG